MIRCPGCGSDDVKQSKELNSYICNRCRSTFFYDVNAQNESKNQTEKVHNETIKQQEKDVFDFDRLLNSMVLLKTENTEGVGFIISEQGHILTNAHVLDGAPFCFGQLAEKSKLIEFNVIADGDSMKLDICLLEPSTTDRFIPMKFSTKPVRIGQTVYTIGNPKGLGLSLSKGYVSQVKDDQIQLDMTVNSGNSGGPVLNESGEVVGIISYLLKDVHGLGFAVNLAAINRFLESSK